VQEIRDRSGSVVLVVVLVLVLFVPTTVARANDLGCTSADKAPSRKAEGLCNRNRKAVGARIISRGEKNVD